MRVHFLLKPPLHLAMVLRFAAEIGVGANCKSGLPIVVKLSPEMSGRICSYLTAAMMTVGGIVWVRAGFSTHLIRTRYQFWWLVI